MSPPRAAGMTKAKTDKLSAKAGGRREKRACADRYVGRPAPVPAWIEAPADGRICGAPTPSSVARNSFCLESMLAPKAAQLVPNRPGELRSVAGEVGWFLPGAHGATNKLASA